jgi:glycosyltransferase involved in cell wall biosynthesis
MILIASFPGSGNTFLRNILYEVYGLESSMEPINSNHIHDENVSDYQFVKTHMLPHKLPAGTEKAISIYLIRDGRDALCSIAHQKKELIGPGTDFYQNLQEVIINDNESFFGGWAQNITKWVEKADLVIRYEDLISNPQKVLARINKLFPLPTAHWDQLPSFKQMKNRINKYGSGVELNIIDSEKLKFSTKNFRKGKPGSWKEEMPDELHDLFWSKHGDTMEMLGYARDGEIRTPNRELCHVLLEKLGIPLNIPDKKEKVLIEANKLVSNDNDGISRYQSELLKAMWPIANNPYSKYDIYLFINEKTIPLGDCENIIFRDFDNKKKKKLTIIDEVYEKAKSDTEFKISSNEQDKTYSNIKSYNEIFTSSPFQNLERKTLNAISPRFKNFLYKNNILVFHKTYDLLRPINKFTINLFPKIYRSIQSNYFQTSHRLNKVKKAPKKFKVIHLPLQQHYRPFEKMKSRFLVTVHDFTHLYFPQYHTPMNIKNAKEGLNFIMKKKAHVIAISKSTYSDSLKEMKMVEKRLHLVTEAVDKEKFYFSVNYDVNLKILEKYGLDVKHPYLLCLSTIEPRKNLSNTIIAFISYLENNPDSNVNLVVAGKRGWMDENLILRNYSNRVLFTGFIEDQDLSGLYSQAIALCYLSFYEGFGLPALEAMRCKTPVIFANNSSLPEVVGQGGLAVDPYDLEDIECKMKMIIHDKELRNTLGLLALKHSTNFSWRKTAEDTLSVYERIINKD